MIQWRHRISFDYLHASTIPRGFLACYFLAIEPKETALFKKCGVNLPEVIP